MTVYHQKSSAVTNLDATPQVRNQAGKTDAARVKVVDAVVTPTASAGIDSTIQFFRVPWTAIIKRLEFKSEAQDTTGQFDGGVYYATDGSNALSKASLLAADAVDQDFFFTGAQFDPGGVASWIQSNPGGGIKIINATPAIFSNAAWAVTENDVPLWSAAGLSANPGGNADIALTVVEAPGAATVAIRGRLEYVEA